MMKVGRSFRLEFERTGNLKGMKSVVRLLWWVMLQGKHPQLRYCEARPFRKSWR